jgi:hypothetical protein
MAETYRPTKGMQEAASRALAWIKDGQAGQGFTDVGRKRASDIAAGRSMSAEIVVRMYSFFARHEVDKKATGFSAGEEGYPSPGRVSWDAWGGDAGFSWSTKIKNQLDNNVRALQKMTSEEGEMMVDATTSDLTKKEIRTEPYGIDGDPVLHNVMAADAAMDAAQDLLANNIDPIVSQAYYLICAADAALSEVIEALGGVDPDDEMSEPVEPAEPADQVDGMLADQGMPPLRTAEIDPAIEARKTAMQTAERITMLADIRSVATEDGSLKIGGYAATFNQEADGLNFREVIAPGAFTRTLQSDQPMFLLVNHDFESLPLASTQSGTLRLAEDSVGLRMEATLDPMNPRAAELASALSRGDVDKMSFAFTVADGGDTREGGLRTLTDLDLYEVSVVTMPAYSSTSVGMRSAEDDNLALRKRQLQLKFNQLRLRK